LVTGGGLKTGIGASAPVLPPPSFSTRQVFILTTLNKLLFMLKTLSWNQTMANKFRKSFAIRFSKMAKPPHSPVANAKSFAAGFKPFILLGRKRLDSIRTLQLILSNSSNPLPYYRSFAAGLNPLPYYAGFKPSTLA
jgi:hypothetical protein